MFPKLKENQYLLVRLSIAAVQAVQPLILLYIHIKKIAQHELVVTYIPT